MRGCVGSYSMKARSIFFFGLENSNFSVEVFFFPRKILFIYFKFFRHRNSKKMLNTSLSIPWVFPDRKLWFAHSVRATAMHYMRDQSTYAHWWQTIMHIPTIEVSLFLCTGTISQQLLADLLRYRLGTSGKVIIFLKPFEVTWNGSIGLDDSSIQLVAALV